MTKASLFSIFLFFTFVSCKSIYKKDTSPDTAKRIENITVTDSIGIQKEYKGEQVVVPKDVAIHSYFMWMDSTVATHNLEKNFRISEYTIVHNNPWLMDTLAHTDYYYLKDRGIFNKDSKSLIALGKGQTLLMPDSLQNERIKAKLSNTYIDINIPEFRLRIIENGKVKFKFPIRVGQNDKRFLAMAQREVDMRTKPGVGKIIRVNKSPLFINPRDNHQYTTTKRDDDHVTMLPIIPWLEPEINESSFRTAYSSHYQFGDPEKSLFKWLYRASGIRCLEGLLLCTRRHKSCH